MRGLKYIRATPRENVAMSHPAWDAWIEIPQIGYALLKPGTSHPAWDAWIEIFLTIATLLWKFFVASRMGCVD